MQPEGNKLESCSSTSSAHGTARTEAQRLGLLACLATSNFTRTFLCPHQVPQAALLPKCEGLQIACSQKGLAWESCCSASSVRGTARTEAPRLGLLACLATSNFKCSIGGPCLAPLAALLPKCERLQIASRQKQLAWKGVAQPLLPMALLA